MKIGIISTVGGYRWAGSEELWFRTALHALSEGHHVSALIASEMLLSTEIKNFQSSGGIVKVRKSFLHPRITSFKESIHSTYKNFLAKHDINLLSVGSLLDVLFIPGLYQALMQSKNKFIFLCQFNSDLIHFNRSQRAEIKSLLEASHAQIFVSSNNLELAQRQFATEFKNASVIYNPIKVSVEHPLPMPDVDKFQFACVARFETLWKGHDVLLDILHTEPWRERNWHLNFYGDGPDVQYVYDLIKFYGLTEKVTHHGQVKDIKSVWRDNHLMVLASRGEGTPLAVLEAMMCGRPTVTTDVGGNCEIIKEDINGWIAEAPTAFSFGNTLERAWQNRERWNELGIEAFHTATELSKQAPVLTLYQLLIKSMNSA